IPGRLARHRHRLRRARPEPDRLERAVPPLRRLGRGEPARPERALRVRNTPEDGDTVVHGPADLTGADRRHVVQPNAPEGPAPGAATGSGGSPSATATAAASPGPGGPSSGTWRAGGRASAPPRD